MYLRWRRRSTKHPGWPERRQHCWNCWMLCSRTPGWLRKKRRRSFTSSRRRTPPSGGNDQLCLSSLLLSGWINLTANLILYFSHTDNIFRGFYMHYIFVKSWSSTLNPNFNCYRLHLLFSWGISQTADQWKFRSCFKFYKFYSIKNV